MAVRLLCHQIRISAKETRLNEAKRKEMDELNIKCLQVLRALIHNEERKLCEDWETRTGESKSSMLEYFLSTREEVFFMAVRDRMQLSTNSIKEKRSLQAQQKARMQEAADNLGSTSSDYSFTISKLALKTKRKQSSSSAASNKQRKKPSAAKDKKTKNQKTLPKNKSKKEIQANGFKKEVTFANPLMKEEEALMIDMPELEPEVSVKIEVMARMCDGQNQQLQNYLREQPDNVKSFDIIAEVTRFLDVVYSNINGRSIDLVIQLFDSINEFTASNQDNRVVIYDNKIIDYINFILRAGDFADCLTEKVLELRQSIANLIVSLIEENGPGPSQVAKEVKDTLDKKAVLQLMTECYEMHQPDKTKLEDLKNLSGSGSYMQTAKSFALAGGSFIQGVIRVLREEVKEKLKWNVDRSSPSNKIRDLMEWAKDIMKDIAYQRRILGNPLALLLTKGWLFWNHMVTILSFAINIMMLITWNAKASLQKGNSTLVEGKSLVWVGILGMVVFYLYGIIGFAMMRNMFDPNEYLYCASLWQCTVTVVRYGLIGDLFESIKAHKDEATFAKFGLVVLFHVSFFIFITTIGLNIIFGIIVDTFSELRDLKVLICGSILMSNYFHIFSSKGFEHHVTYEHNMWAYIFFFIHLNGTKVNDYNALEMYVFRLLNKENYDFFPLDRALSLASMGKDATETKLDDLLDQVTSIVEKQRREETEKKRREERMRQKLWEQKHRLGSFRRKAKLPVPREYDPLMQMQGGQFGAMEDPRYMTMRQFGDAHNTGMSQPNNGGNSYSRPEKSGSIYTSSISQGTQITSLREYQEADTPRHYRGFSPLRYDADEPGVRNLSPVCYDDRTHSPSRSRHGSDSELLGFSPIHTRRQSRDSSYIRQVSPKWVDSQAASPKTSSVFFPDSDSTPSLNMRDQRPPERAMPTVDLVTDPLEEFSSFVISEDIASRESDGEDIDDDFK
uniref:RyR/IP3R Homology associated domain-containing protein n=1 Tax=Octopus bimaculoides TaxID=37653 RepID=A0A0L8I7T5_OCTBM